MTYQNLNFHCAHEGEQGICYVLELINLANLDDKAEPSRHLIDIDIDCGCFKWSVFDLTIPLKYLETLT